MIDALFGQGIIGSFAAPSDPGTASVKLMHHQGDLLGLGSVWGYVEGGMGRVSFAIAAAAQEAGAALATGVPVAEIVPGEGVVLESGDRIAARAVLCNADPKRALAMLGSAELPDEFRDRLESWKVRSSVVKLNAALARPADLQCRWPGRAAAGDGHDHAGARPPPRKGLRPAGAASRGSASRSSTSRPDMTRLWHRAGASAMSAFVHYAPYELAQGTWDSAR